MKSILKRGLSVAVLVIMSALVLMGATASPTTTQEPDKLILLSTTDVKGKTSPCG